MLAALVIDLLCVGLAGSIDLSPDQLLSRYGTLQADQPKAPHIRLWIVGKLDLVTLLFVWDAVLS